MTQSGLIIVDVQNDFLDGGTLVVPDGRAVIAPINALMRDRGADFTAIVATQDWHPPAHCSFSEQGGLWPVHCVAGTPGADFPDALESAPITHIVRKGVRQERDSYSAFLENDRRTPTGLDGLLRGLDISRLTIVGLALDYCVGATAFDAAELGYEVRIILKACRGIVQNDAALLARFEKAGIILDRD